jgi:uncharacterized protein YecE (DUF72 family)
MPANGMGRKLGYYELVAGRIYVGVAGWSYKDWEDVVYPATLKGADRLGYLAQFFDLVEINTSFYGPIKPSMGQQWCWAVEAVNPSFLFTAKLYRAFTHSPVAEVEPTSGATIHATRADELHAKAGFDSIASRGRLGAVLVQFPISFKCTDENRRYVEKLVSRFRIYPLVLEVRHASWNEPSILDWLVGLGVGLCNIDQPLLGRALQPSARAISSIGYIRLHGRNYRQWFADTNVRDRYNYLYTERELEEWKSRAEQVAAKTKMTFVVANNHNLGKAAVNALELVHMLGGKKVKAPAQLVAAYPRLRGITTP